MSRNFFAKFPKYLPLREVALFNLYAVMRANYWRLLSQRCAVINHFSQSPVSVKCVSNTHVFAVLFYYCLICGDSKFQGLKNIVFPLIKRQRCNIGIYHITTVIMLMKMSLKIENICATGRPLSPNLDSIIPKNTKNTITPKNIIINKYLEYCFA